MCSITGFFNNDNSLEHALSSLEITKNRGLDGIGICTNENVFRAEDVDSLSIDSEIPERNVMGHRLHSMVNFVLQPLVYKGKIAANCEIYNWKELAEKYDIKAKNDTDLLIQLIEKKAENRETEMMQLIDDVLREVIGVYAIAYWLDDTVYIARDIVGLKPLWYSNSDGFAFCSEKKALARNGFADIKELNPREILAYNIKTGSLEKFNREFFSIIPEHEGSMAELEKVMLEKLEDSISIRMPEEKFGILFSGGLDSTIIACLCKLMGKNPGIDFTCYTAGLAGVQLPPDVEYAKKMAYELGLDLKIKIIDLDEVEEYLKDVVPLVEDSNVPKVGVALTMYAACVAAREDGIRVMFSGSGADEIFAGYDRHKRSTDISRDCYADVLKIYEKNTYRDDVVSMNNNIELRVPYLDKRFVAYCLKIPPEYKINEEQNKLILRMLAEEIGIPAEVSQRRKQAAQYGSRFDKAIGKLAKKAGCKTKTEYLKQFYGQPNLKLGVLFSSGKDSNYAMHVMQQQNYSIECLITIKSQNLDSYMFHTPNIDLVRLQAEAMELPLIEELTKGEKEKELDDMKNAIIRAKDEYGIEGVITGALYSNYQRERIEKVCDELGLKAFSPLWHIDQEKEMYQLLDLGFEFIFSSVAAYGLNKSWVGRIISEKDIEKLVRLNEKIGLNVAGEGGEFESFVTDGPMYHKKIEIREMEVIERDEYTAKVVITNAVLVDKE
ncbi:metal-binding-domain/4Fe-4S-binding-domain containing ABC transporter, ATP-binding protein [Methanolobus tindarius DSM 2278]|uniref:Metal-binding-domain/4Fe-4S-binding-domain containing ABC transporter, ATP-binding protein n=1 Tax=Methanolobus tindarius DSM 2278 TaxID=1090322 RepID=W9DNU5_METTI|nr:diphthine--ammonia ligase [Methanolobus tindarius]ETA66675.1 metal-binding-domain/4Fe-4S-binding-domain containing ABC transporter, ATP-binding protein [Methanolobus tindarius DSM 2278]